MNPFELLGIFLDRLHKRSQALAFLVAVLIAVACTAMAAWLNQDSSFVATTGVKA